MAAGEEWKKVCKQMLTATARRWKEANGRPWEIDETSIFAEIDAFVQQRCKDLLEVCEGQIQFGGKAAGDPGSNESTVPCFGGTRGPEIAKSLVDIQKSFEKQVCSARARATVEGRPVDLPLRQKCRGLPYGHRAALHRAALHLLHVSAFSHSSPEVSLVCY